MTTPLRALDGRWLTLWTTAVVLAVVSLASASSASAQNAKANTLYRSGAQLQNDGKFDLAIPEYEQLLKDLDPLIVGSAEDIYEYGEKAPSSVLDPGITND